MMDALDVEAAERERDALRWAGTRLLFAMLTAKGSRDFQAAKAEYMAWVEEDAPDYWNPFATC